MRFMVLTLSTIASLSGLPSRAATRDVLNGEVRTHYESGQLHELKHYKNGREEGLQQAWTELGSLYLNYEMRNGRRYGLVNARPCIPVSDGSAP
jgi:hypothetical protein